MAASVLLIPGTSGNKLMLDAGTGSPVDIGWPGALSGQAWLCGDGSFDTLTNRLGFSTQTIADTLAMEFKYDGPKPTRTSLRANASIVPGPIIHAAYNQFADATVFAYDWRSDVRASAERLADLLQTTPGDKKWRVVTHSQGGLVLIAAAKILGARDSANGTRALSKYVSHAALCACPLYGTINAADALANGNNLSARFRDSFRKIARTWPALYQMLPAWPGSVQTANSSGSLLADAAWSGTDIDLSMLERARVTRSMYFRFPLMYFSRVKVRLSMSTAQMTHNTMRKNGGTLTPAGTEPGDTLVPYYTTRKQMNDIERQASYAFGGRHAIAEHFMLLNDPAISSDIRSFFSQ